MIEIIHEKKMKEFEKIKKEIPKKIELLKKTVNEKKRIELENEIYQLEIYDQEYFLQNAFILNQLQQLNEIEISIQKNENDIKTDSDNENIENEDSLEFGNTRKGVFKIKNISKKRKELEKLYLTNIGEEESNIYYDDKEDSQLCNVCNSNTLIINNDSESCQNCGNVCCNQIYDGINIEWKKLPYKESLNNSEFKFNFFYKRRHHFDEILSQIQGIEMTTIPDEIIEIINSEIKKEGIKDLNKLTNKKMKEFLRKNDKSNYYEHISFIIKKIKKTPVLVIPKQLQDQLRIMFNLVEEKYIIHKPSNRKNFLNYKYVFYKFFELLNLPDYQKHFDLLKSKNKLYEHDQIWKKICLDLNWHFYETI